MTHLCEALALRMHAEGPKRMTLRATGPGPVTAGQIETPAQSQVDCDSRRT